MKALVLAGYLVQKCLDEGWKITNLKLQKMLYFIQLRAIQLGEQPLIDDQFEAWMFGPVVENVYYAYCINAGLDIDQTEKYDGRHPKIPSYVEDVFKHFISRSSWSMVQLTHRDGGAWQKNYVSGSRNLIPINDIREDALSIGEDKLVDLAV